MLQVSDGAKSLLKDLLEARPDPAHCFRLSKQEEGFELQFDTPAEGDILFQHEETDVLAVTEDAAAELEGATIDKEDSPEGPRLVLVQ